MHCSLFGLLNAWIWLVYEHRIKLCNYFQGNPGLECNSYPYHFAKWFQLFQSSFQPTIAEEPKPTMTLTKLINIVNNRIKMTNYPLWVFFFFLAQKCFGFFLRTDSTYSFFSAFSPFKRTHIQYRQALAQKHTRTETALLCRFYH